MRRYETIFIIRPNVAEDGITEINDRTAKIIEDRSGTIVKTDLWGLKKLAYPIKKEQQGYYVLMEYAGTPEAVTELERIFKIDERVLKFMTIKLQDVYIPDAVAPEEENAGEAEGAAEEQASAPVQAEGEEASTEG